ncbi:MAG: purine-nucleoside phosphorylase [Clostridiales bacterium]|nr:purine-nucleoside phosphorylase [Clostridiales bacterium]
MKVITYEKILETADYIKSKINLKPDIALILGSGLGSFTDNITDRIEIPYEEIPNFPISTVKGHGGKLVIGKLNGKNVIAMKGRIHFYEGYSMQETTFPIRVFKLLGAEKLLTVSAVGAINTNYHSGDIVIINDYIKLTSLSPLLGTNMEEFGERFPNMNGNTSLIPIMKNIFNNNFVKPIEAVYAFMAGPQYETKAEVNMLRMLGADVVGMSTVPEIIVAKHANMEVCSLGCVTNAVSDADNLSHEEVLQASEKAKDKLTKIILDFIKEI